MSEKLLSMLYSRRFLAAVLGIAGIAAQDLIGLSESDAATISAMIMAWIIGDSINKTRLTP